MKDEFVNTLRDELIKYTGKRFSKTDAVKAMRAVFAAIVTSLTKEFVRAKKESLQFRVYKIGLFTLKYSKIRGGYAKNSKMVKMGHTHFPTLYWNPAKWIKNYLEKVIMGKTKKEIKEEYNQKQKHTTDPYTAKVIRQQQKHSQ